MSKDKVTEAAWLGKHCELTRLISDCGRASYGRYRLGCRCGACRSARCAYDESRRQAAESGSPSTFVDAEPVRRRIEELRAAGYTYAEISRLTGIAASQLRSVTVGYWRTGMPVRKVKRTVKDAVFGIRGQRCLSARQRVSAEWMGGWLREYEERGVALRQISERTGLSVVTLRDVRKGKSRVEARTFHAFLKAKPGIDRLAGRRSA